MQIHANTRKKYMLNKVQDKHKSFNLVSCFFLKDQEKTEKKKFL